MIRNQKGKGEAAGSRVGGGEGGGGGEGMTAKHNDTGMHMKMP